MLKVVPFVVTTEVFNARKGRNAYKILADKPEGKNHLGRTSSRWEDNITTDLTEAGCQSADWTHPVEDMNHCGFL
jgi:hypothetical protein